MRDQFALGPIYMRGPQEGDPPSEWMRPIHSLFSAWLSEATDDLAERMTESHLALAIVSDKDVAKALKREKEAPVLDVLRRQQRWARDEQLPAGGVFGRNYPPCDWFEDVLRDAYSNGLRGRFQIMKRLWEEIRLRDPASVDATLSIVGIRSGAVYRILTKLAGS